MKAHSGINLGVFLAQGHRQLAGGNITSWIQDKTHPRFPGIPDNGFHLIFKTRIIQMGVAI